MARVTIVNKAQQRYETVPVIDPETGEPKRTPVMKKDRETGERVQKVSKRGPVFMTVTTKDKSKPLPNLRCDFPGCDIDGGEIKPGSSYKHISPKSGPYGGIQKNRHIQHPSWQVWEYSNSWSARVAQVVHGFSVDEAESPEDVTSALEDLAGEIEGLADESEEAADNIEDGFGHETYQSEEARQRAEDLRGWADEVRSVDVPELPDDEVDCEECGGSGQVPNPEYNAEATEAEDPNQDGVEEEIDCDDCQGTGQVTPDEPTDEQMDAWRDEVDSAVDDAVNSSPV